MKYQPTEVDSLIFDSIEHKQLVQKWIENKKIDGNVLMHGPAGLGKTATAELLIHNIIFAQNDLFRMKSRSVKEIDDNLRPFLTKRPVRSNQKIVYIEEMDKISSAASVALKEGLMEKYQDTTSFICCSNYYKKIDPPVLTRFTYKISFSGKNFEDIARRLGEILQSESAEYDSEQLLEYIKNHHSVGIRELINRLQLQYIANDGKIDFKTLEEEIGIEENIVQLITIILSTIMTTTSREKDACYISPLNSSIAKEYQQLLALLHNNTDVNYDLIFERFYDTTKFLPFKDICIKYAETIENKKFPHAHVLGCVTELMKSAINITG